MPDPDYKALCAELTTTLEYTMEVDKFPAPIV